MYIRYEKTWGDMMKGYDFLKINDRGNLEISGCDAVELAKEYGTPLYIMAEDEIRKRLREVKVNHIDKYGGFAVYAGKAFLNKEMCRIVKSEGLGLDVVSGGELYTAASGGFPMENVIFHGNNKSLDELQMAVELNVGRIVADNFYELENLEKIAEHKNKKLEVLIRISPGIDTHTHNYIQTGQVDSKFGFSIFDQSAFRAAKYISKSKWLGLKGLHSHLGSQLTQNSIYAAEIETLAGFAKTIKDELGIEIQELNAGGGFGIYYVDTDKRYEISYFTEVINSAVNENFSRLNLKKPLTIIEPGRWIIGEAGVTLYTIGSIKNIEGVRKYISVDGGMADNPRPPLYDAQYSAVAAASNKDENECEIVTIAGKCCESGDILIRDINMPRLSS